MNDSERRHVIVQATVNAPLEKVWECWNEPEHIVGWAFDSEDWKITYAENDLSVGGMFRIETVRTASDIDRVVFVGTYTNIKKHELIEYDTGNGQHVIVKFEKIKSPVATRTPLADAAAGTPPAPGSDSDSVRITETFEPENGTSVEEQEKSWRATLENFKVYVER